MTHPLWNYLQNAHFAAMPCNDAAGEGARDQNWQVGTAAPEPTKHETVRGAADSRQIQ